MDTLTENPQQKSEQVFLASLSSIFKEPFNAKIYPGTSGEIERGQVNTNQMLETQQIHELISLSGSNNLNINIARSGAGLKVEFYK